MADTRVGKITFGGILVIKDPKMKDAWSLRMKTVSPNCWRCNRKGETPELWAESVVVCRDCYLELCQGELK